MPPFNETRLMIKIARMYYIQELRQQDITERLKIHQSTVSRLLKRARERQVVRVSVDVPTGIFAELEEELEQKFSLREAIVVDCPDDELHMLRELGAAAAFFLESTVQTGEVIGISSWSRHLLAMVDQMSPGTRGLGGKVVQIVGGVGTPEIQSQATYLAQRLAGLLGAEPVLLPAPGIISNKRSRDVLLQEGFVKEAMSLFPSLDTALVGIGALQPSNLLASSGNVFAKNEIDALQKVGAVGDICFRFFDADGKQVKTQLTDRVIGIDLQSLQKVSRVVGIAGGKRKLTAILGALKGKLINSLITDRTTAQKIARSNG